MGCCGSITADVSLLLSENDPRRRERWTQTSHDRAPRRCQEKPLDTGDLQSLVLFLEAGPLRAPRLIEFYRPDEVTGFKSENGEDWRREGRSGAAVASSGQVANCRDTQGYNFYICWMFFGFISSDFIVTYCR